MSERKKNPAKNFDGAAERFEKLERLFEEITGRLEEIEAQLLGATPLDEGSAVDLTAWEKKWDEKYFRLSSKQRDLEALENRVRRALEFMENARKDFPAPGIQEARNWKPAAGTKMNELEGLLGKRSIQNKASRWVSFLVDLGKKH